jgi:hypothetical protein
MSTTAIALERELVHDLEALAERFADEDFCGDLYRALANNVWTKDEVEGHVSFSSRRADQLVNELRMRLAGRAPLALAQSGGEGEISRLVADELGRMGWRARGLNTEREDVEHLPAADAPPTRALRYQDFELPVG